MKLQFRRFGVGPGRDHGDPMIVPEGGEVLLTIDGFPGFAIGDAGYLSLVTLERDFESLEDSPTMEGGIVREKATKYLYFYTITDMTHARLVRIHVQTE